MAAKIPTGPLAGYTLAQLTALRTTLQEEMMRGQGTLTGSGVNGQSFSFAPGLSVTARLRMVNAAIAQLQPASAEPRNTIYARFSSPC